LLSPAKPKKEVLSNKNEKTTPYYIAEEREKLRDQALRIPLVRYVCPVSAV
jgi:hypothetical protein